LEEISNLKYLVEINKTMTKKKITKARLNEVIRKEIKKSADKQKLTEAVRKAVRKALLLSEVDAAAIPKDFDARFPLKLSKVNKDTAAQATTTGQEDGEPKDDVIGVNAKPTGVAPVQKLKPSQSSMNIAKALTFALHMIDHPAGKMEPGGDLGAFISQDGYIMDGHHRWISTAMVDPSKQVGGFLVSFPGEQLVAILNAMTKGKFGVMDGKPASGGFDQFKEAPIKAQLGKFVQGGISAETAGKVFKGWQAMDAAGVQAGLEAFTGQKGPAAVDAAVAKMVKNLSGLTMSTPSWAPTRPDMPVIDEPDVPAAVKALKGGEVDWNDPKAKA